MKYKGKDLFKLFRYFVSRYPRRTFFVCSVMLVSSFFESIGLVTLLPLVDVVVGNGEASNEIAKITLNTLEYLDIPTTLGPLLGFLMVCLILKESLKSFALILAGYSTSKVAMDFRLMLIKTLFDAKWNYYIGLRTGGFSNTMSTEALRASSIYMDTVKFFMLVVQMSIYAVLGLLVSWQVAVAAFVTGIISYLILNILVKISRQAGNLQTEAFHFLTAKITDLLSAIKVFKAMGNNNLYFVLSDDIKNLDLSYRKQVISSAIMTLFQELMPIVLIIIVVYIGLSIAKVELSSFVVASVLFLSLLRRINTFQKIFMNAVNKESAFFSIQNTLKAAKDHKETYSGKSIASINKEIRYENISVKHGEQSILDSVNMIIPSKSLTVIIGGSGEGKTSLVDMMIGLNEIASGAISFDGVSLRDLDLDNLRHRVGYVGQDVVLFNDTVMNNITMNDNNIPEQDVITALKKAHAFDFVMAMENGLESNVGERGSKLSGGQKQKLCIARAIVRNPDILIFDEVTSSLDSKSDADISELAKELSSDITIIAITHREKLTSYADTIYIVKDNRVSRQDVQPN